MRFRSRIGRIVRTAAFAPLLLTLSCVLIFKRIETREESLNRGPVTINAPIKVHLADGRTALFASSASITTDSILGSGQIFDLTLRNAQPTRAIALGDAVGIESFNTRTNVAASLLVSTALTAAAVGASALLAVAIFGSCPTIYSDSAGTWAMEAEGFSYSIAQLFERRDVDRLRALPDAKGVLRLEVRNEALETHYIDYMELLEARHRPGERVLPDPENRLVAFGDLTAPTTAIDRARRDVQAVIANADRETFSTDRRTIAGATVADLEDHLTLEFPRPADTDSVALVLTMRNSLLNTVLFYDVMLGASGAHALDWLGKDLLSISGAASLGRWYSTRMGARVEIWANGDWQPVGRVADSGPIAWKETALMLPVRGNDAMLRLRLSFVADQWRFDRIALGAAARHVEFRTIPIARALDRDEAAVDSLRATLADGDARYVRTMPGDRMTLHFETGTAPDSVARTFMIASQGYYTEWVRPGWVRRASRSSSFTPNDSAFVEALRRWDASRDSLEHRFYTTRIPVR